MYQYLQDLDFQFSLFTVCGGRDGGSRGRGCPREGTFHCSRTRTITEGGKHSILIIMGRFNKQRKRLSQFFAKKHELFLLPISLFKTETSDIWWYIVFISMKWIIFTQFLCFCCISRENHSYLVFRLFFWRTFNMYMLQSKCTLDM